MRGTVSKAWRVYRRGGTGAFAHASLSYLRQWIRGSYYLLDGRRTFDVADSEVEVLAERPREAWKWEAIYASERAVRRGVLDELEDGDVFWDVGAYLGMYALFAAAAGAEAVAFEPNPASVDRLEANVALNEVSVDVREVALADETARAGLHTGEDVRLDDTAGLADSRGSVAVETVEGDSLVADGDVSAPDVVKVDVEGAERLVLDGMTDLLDGGCRAVFCEIHPDALERRGSSPADVERLLQSHGFEVERIPGGIEGLNYHVRAVASDSG